MTMTTADATAAVFDALGDPTRVKIVITLCDAGPESTLRVAHSVSLSRQAATKHLELLQAAGMVSSAKRGRQRIWKVEVEPLVAASDWLIVLSQRWDRAVTRLQTLLEEDA